MRYAPVTARTIWYSSGPEPSVTSLSSSPPRSQVPDAHLLVVAARDGVAAVRRERDAAHFGRVAEAPRLVARRQVPQAHRAVGAARKAHRAVRRNRDAPDRLVVRHAPQL